MLHQIKAPKFYAYFLKIISLLRQSSISEVEISIFHKILVLGNSRKVLEKSLNFTQTWLYEPCRKIFYSVKSFTWGTNMAELGNPLTMPNKFRIGGKLGMVG